MQITVIGLGEVGSETFRELHKKVDVTGVDISPQRVAEFKRKGYDVRDNAPTSDVYIIATYTTQQVIDVLKGLDLSYNPLVVIESTIDPDSYEEMRAWATDRMVDLVSFPHRFNPNDPVHHVFNLNRVIGATNQRALDRALQFYTQFMPRDLLHVTSFEVASLSKVAENAYRFMEIALAQEIKQSCESIGIDFGALREAMNTKWNIDVKEARDGVKGKCLPKDMKLLTDYLKENKALKTLYELNEQYVLKSLTKKTI
jgi:nucleotide sugar dehydrogenase